MSMQNSIIDANTTAVIVLIKKFIMILLWFYMIVVLCYRSRIGSLFIIFQYLFAA